MVHQASPHTILPDRYFLPSQQTTPPPNQLLTMDESTELEHTGFLLQKLQELKLWQQQQEAKLLQVHDFEMDQILQKSTEDPPTDDDTTIGNLEIIPDSIYTFTSILLFRSRSLKPPFRNQSRTFIITKLGKSFQFFIKVSKRRRSCRQTNHSECQNF